MSDELVTLMSSDAEKFEVAQDVAFKSETIKNMIEGEWTAPSRQRPFPCPDDFRRRSLFAPHPANDRRDDR